MAECTESCHVYMIPASDLEETGPTWFDLRKHLCECEKEKTTDKVKNG